jgi:nucleoside-diphosphate-sugar epimerase
MRTLVTGANGFMGAWLSRRLLERGHEVRCLVRDGRVSGLEGLSVDRVVGDVLDPPSVRRAMEGVELVFHLAGIRRAPEKDAFFRVNAQGTRAVCEAMAAAGARRLVLCSSLAASGPSTPERPRQESDPFQPAEWYGESKAEAERIAFSFADRLEVTASRPSRVVGPGDRENLPFFKMVKRGWRLVIGGPERPISFVDVEDVIDLLLLLGERPEAKGEAFFSTGEAISLPKLLDVVAQTLGVKTRSVLMPPAVLRALAAGADVVSRVTGRHLPLNRKLAKQLLVPAWTCSGDKARRLLGHSPTRSVVDSIRRTADWYRAEGWL